MKYLIASDIHGSAYFAKKLIERYEKEGADRLVLLGDILYHGPRNELPKDYCPKEVIPLLNAHKDEILCVRGNCDSEVDQMVLEFPIMADYAIIDTDKITVFATHGHLFNKEKLPPLKKGDALLFGHFHVPECAEKDGVLFLNPGSTSIPKNESHHGYMTLENGTFTWKDMDGNVKNTYNV